ncbi:hypothetical protein O3G_MSEX012386 [Manduca sexta]|nr:hypothetical protein O3G_MSEX012386 [Manduca sexta]KAG6461037.1 hypothetical protein O3G_MSEX012386 [Manduca sexta]
MYQNCLKFCIKGNCTNDGYRFSPKSSIQQDFWCKLIGWTCSDECRYICMWNTVEKFQAQHGYVPKFHGKWPFTRMLGMQEPASAIASMLNLATNAYMYGRIRSEFTVRKVPIVLFWHGFALVCMNAWMWSTIFHTRDTDFTEFMDYACALSMVMGLFIAVIVRWVEMLYYAVPQQEEVRSSSTRITATVLRDARAASVLRENRLRPQHESQHIVW